MQRVATDRCRCLLPFVVPVVAGAWLLVACDAYAATPIANDSPTSLPSYSGAPATRKPIRARQPPRTMHGAVTSPGVTRIDVDTDGCHVVWENTTERVPSVVSKVSARTGLVYTFTKDPDPVNTTADAWFWTALDFETGALVWKHLAGTGLG